MKAFYWDRTEYDLHRTRRTSSLDGGGEISAIAEERGIRVPAMQATRGYTGAQQAEMLALLRAGRGVRLVLAFEGEDESNAIVIPPDMAGCCRSCGEAPASPPDEVGGHSDMCSACWEERVTSSMAHGFTREAAEEVAGTYNWSHKRLLQRQAAEEAAYRAWRSREATRPDSDDPLGGDGWRSSD